MPIRLDKKALLEAALFMANKPVTIKDLKKILRCDEERIKQVVAELKEDLKTDNRGIHLIETEEGYQMKVKPKFVPRVRHLTPFQELSRGLLRVLAIVAYKQPVTQSDIVKVIGNRTYEYVKILEQKGLIKTVKQGRTKALFATKGFAEYFGFENPEDVKTLLEGIIKEGGNDEDRDEQSGPDVSDE